MWFSSCWRIYKPRIILFYVQPLVHRPYFLHKLTIWQITIILDFYPLVFVKGPSVDHGVGSCLFLPGAVLSSLVWSLLWPSVVAIALAPHFCHLWINQQFFADLNKLTPMGVFPYNVNLYPIYLRICLKFPSR